MNVVSKFTVGSESGIDFLFELKEAQLKEMYKGVADQDQLKNFIESQLDRRKAINELNDLTTQLIITFGDDKPLGYAIIKNSFDRPNILKDEKAVRLHLYLLPEYQTSELFQSLWQKCLTVTKGYSHWIEIPFNTPLMPFLKDCEFKMFEKSTPEPFGMPSLIMIRQMK